MRFLVYLFTLLLFSTAVAQNPVILQGSYVTNVFGPSNFIKNPNAQNNTSDVFTSGGVITRSLTTPLVATTEFNVTTNTSTNNIYWTTRTFDAGTKNQNCEARFTYRGFTTGTTTAQITNNNTTVIAELVLVGSASDPRTVSINFPCGDPSTSKELRLQQSVAQLTGVNEIGGIYMGLATNMANVAQAEAVGGYNITVSGVYPQTTSSVTANLSLGSSTLVPFGKATSADAASGSVTFSYLPAGNYSIVYTAHSVTGVATSCIFQWYEDTSGQQSGFQYSANDTNWSMVSGYFAFTSGGSRTFRIRARRTGGSGICGIDPNLYAQMVVYRFPSSSELVVTPERQNWYVSAKHTGGLVNLGTSNISTRTEMTHASLTLTPDAGSQPVATVCSGTNPPPALSTSATTCAAGNESLGLTFNIPSVGSYEVCAQFGSNVESNALSYADQMFSIEETSTSAATALTSNSTTPRYANSGSADTRTTYPVVKCNVIRFASIGQKAVRLMYMQNVSGTVTQSFVIADNLSDRAVQWTVTPVTNQSNSALYVQGPVKAAATGTASPTGFQGEEIPGTSTAGTGTACAQVTVTPGQWMLYGMAYVSLSGVSAPSVFDIEIETSAGTFSATTGSFVRTPYNGNLDHLLSTFRIVRTTSTATYYLNCRLVGAGTKTNNTSVFHAVRLN